uniref:MFS domain-containing protein n=1 Tax=Panagrellus redivivus TaxID=6233 RepID=A0A7E4V4J7_PANRE
MKFDDLIVEYLGEFGRYQRVQFCLVVLPTLFCALHSLSWTFIAPNVSHRCRLPTDIGEHPIYDIGPSELLTGCDSGNSSNCVYQTCTLKNNQTCQNGYVYSDYSRYTALERWDLICDRHILKPVVQSAYYLGQFLGSLVFGFLGDRYGRKKIFLTAIGIQFFSGIGMSLAPTWYLFALFRVGSGFAHPGIFMTAVILGMELIGPSIRSLASVISGALFSCGQVFLGLAAYFIADYQHLQMTITLPAVLFVTYIWLIPESARWLVSQRRYKEADKILRRAARQNGKHLPETWWEQLEVDSNAGSESRGTEKRNFTDLFRTPRIRCRTFVLFYVWPVVSMAYYGMSMKPDILGNNPYVNFIAGGIFEIPASVFMFLTVDRLGRKPLLIGGLTTAGLTLLSNMFISEAVFAWAPTIQFLLSKASMTLTYSTLYAYTPELFPTEIRNMAVGGCSMMARIGASSASFMVMYLVEIYGRQSITIPFSTTLILAALTVFLVLPETAGAALPETITHLEAPKNVSLRTDDNDKSIPLVEKSPSTD